MATAQELRKSSEIGQGTEEQSKMTMTERLAIHKEIERQNELRRLDFLHGPVVDFRSTETADIWTHADGYKEVAWHEEQEAQTA